MDIYPFTPAPGQTWMLIGVAIGLLLGVPAFTVAFIGYLMENINGRPPRETVDKM